MTFYIIILAEDDEGDTLEELTNWFEHSSSVVTINEGTTDREGRNVILLEFAAGEEMSETEAEELHHILKLSDYIVDYIIYSMGA